MQPSQLFLFDLDGTLIDSRADLAAAVNAMRGNLYFDESNPADTNYLGGGGGQKRDALETETATTPAWTI